MVFLVAIAATAPAHASFPGANGRIAFHGDGDGDAEIYTMKADGTDRVQVTHNEFDGFSVIYDTGPKWSPDGSRLLFTRTTFSASFPPGSGLVTANPDGSGEQRVPVDGDKGWGPDGSRIVFTSGVSCGGPRGECFEDDAFTANADGSGAVSLGRTPTVNEEQVDWSPRGDLIAISGTRSSVDRSDIWTVHADGSGNTRLLATGPASDGDPSWSPDGDRIAYVSDRDGNPEVYVMNADGTGQTRLTDNDQMDGGPAWSPDGTKIAFHRTHCPGAGSRCVSNVLAMDADGANETMLTGNAPDSSVSEASPDWQPIPGPRPADYKNRSRFCKAERAFWGDARFAAKYGSHGGCVSGKR